MMNIKIIKFIFFFFIFLSNFSLLYATSQSDGVNVNVNVNYCNFDNICDPLEDFSSCPSDCTPICNNNNICEAGEDITNCPSDCTPLICNNNNICETGEDTLNCPSDCVTPPTPVFINNGSSGGYIISKYFENLTIEAGYTTAIIKWKSIIPTTSNLKWGTTSDYKDGSLKDINFVTEHKVEINNLKTGTIYYFKIQSENFFGGIIYLNDQSFKTFSYTNTIFQDNPTNIKINSNNSGITISWNNPKNKDFDYIRVMKNLKRFYGSPLIGSIVYEGRGNYFTDSKVKENNKYYYSLFARDKKGNYSSGVPISIIHNPNKKISLENSDENQNITKEIEKQDGKTLPNIYIISQDLVDHDFKIGDIFHLSGDRPINIKTNYFSNITNDDIWVEIRNSDREITQQYFFSQSKDDDGFISAIIPSFEKEGYYSITIYRYFNNVAQIVNRGAFEINKIPVKVISNFSWYIVYFAIFIVIIILIISSIFYIIYKKIRKTI